MNGGKRLLNPGIVRFFGVALLAAVATPAAAAPAWREPLNRREKVAGWLVEDVDASNDLRIVRLSRTVGDIKLEYYSVLTPGTRFYGDNFDIGRGRCRRNGYSSGGTGLAEPAGGAVLERMTADLESCEAGAKESADALAGFPKAFRRLWAWSRERLAEKGQWLTPIPYSPPAPGTPLPQIRLAEPPR
jgi:hypothetical protein